MNSLVSFELNKAVAYSLGLSKLHLSLAFSLFVHSWHSTEMFGFRMNKIFSSRSLSVHCFVLFSDSFRFFHRLTRDQRRHWILSWCLSFVFNFSWNLLNGPGLFPTECQLMLIVQLPISMSISAVKITIEFHWRWKMSIENKINFETGSWQANAKLCDCCSFFCINFLIRWASSTKHLCNWQVFFFFVLFFLLNFIESENFFHSSLETAFISFAR